MLNSISFAIDDIMEFKKAVFYDISQHKYYGCCVSSLRLIDEIEDIIEKDVSFIKRLMAHKDFDEFYIENQHKMILTAESVNGLKYLIDGKVNIKRDIEALTTRTHSFYKNIKSLAEKSKYFKEDFPCYENKLSLFMEELVCEGDGIGNAISRNMKKKSKFMVNDNFNLFTSYKIHDSDDFNLFKSVSERINSKEFPLFYKISKSSFYEDNKALVDGMIDFIKSNRPKTMTLEERIYNISKESITLYEFLKLLDAN